MKRTCWLDFSDDEPAADSAETVTSQNGKWKIRDWSFCVGNFDGVGKLLSDGVKVNEKAQEWWLGM